ncbi:S-adenosyl-L-methionine-dependent methyltransferase [Entophlyctis helioformis]|nr:S-adenosyl-L-methionine-dependent methyltransferase [Entophlyctis helioformis]
MDSTNIDVLPEDNERYGTLDYWEERYQQEDETVTFEWFKGFEDLDGFLTTALCNKSASVLHLGCGNSRLAEDMHKHGWTDIVNVDYSSAVIETMAKRCAGLAGVSWVVADIFKLDDTFAAGSFEYALDKGTLDALLTRKHDPWNPPADLCDEIQSYIKQVALALKPGGKFVHITFAQPHFRRRFLEIPEFKVTVETLTGKTQGAFEYFAYCCVKQ